MKRVLLTGVGGFIGVHCVRYWLEKTDWQIVGLDSFRHKGSFSRLNSIVDEYCEETKASNPLHTGRLEIYYHDLNVPIDPVLENLILKRTFDDRGIIMEKPIHYIVNMASDSAVERSTSDPVHCLRNNFDLMVNMLEFARRVTPEVFLQVSTDEVYGEAPPLPSPGHSEWATIMPNNPYSASKAAQEALAISYWRTYDMPIVITNCMNIIAEMQDPEKFLPRIIQCVATDKEIPIYADNVDGHWKIGSRVYLDARNKADAIMFLLKQKPSRYKRGSQRPDRYNICGDIELNNLEIAQKVADIMGKPLKAKLVPSESARPGYDRRYALNGAKLRNLGWTQPIAFEDTLKRVVEWTKKHSEWIL